MILDIFVGTTTSVAGNIITKAIEAFRKSDKPEMPEAHESEEEKSKLFNTFSIRFGFESIVNITSNPVVHVLIEDEPTTAWHLATIVVESSNTGIWYASQKYELAFEGSGGGLAVAQLVGNHCRKNNIPVAGWVLAKKETDELSKGLTPWPVIKNKAMPLLTYAKNDYFTNYIIDKFKEINT